MNRADTYRPFTRLAIPGLILGILSLTGCAGPTAAPVESRGDGIGQTQAASPSRSDGAGPLEPPPATEATVIPLGSDNPVDAPSARSPATSPGVPAPAPVRPANPAVVALLNRANQQASAGQHAGAASSLERAIKIDPGNPWLWHRLAATRLDQGRPGEAASLAAKSNSLAAGDAELQADNWRLIARVHRQRGEEVAARAAEAKARQLSTPRT